MSKHRSKEILAENARIHKNTMDFIKQQNEKNRKRKQLENENKQR